MKKTQKKNMNNVENLSVGGSDDQRHQRLMWNVGRGEKTTREKKKKMMMMKKKKRLK